MVKFSLRKIKEIKAVKIYPTATNGYAKDRSNFDKIVNHNKKAMIKINRAVKI